MNSAALVRWLKQPTNRAEVPPDAVLFCTRCMKPLLFCLCGEPHEPLTRRALRERGTYV